MESQISLSCPHLPPEMIWMIWSNVPLKALGRLQCISKEYCKMFKSYTFAKSHLAHTANSPPSLLLLGSHSIFRVTTFDSNQHKLYGHLMKFNSDMYQIGGSCDGLVLVVKELYRKILLNPITGEKLELPESPDALDPTWCSCLNGFGYDATMDDYKVVTISYFSSERPDESPDDEHVAYIDVYSLKSNSWTRKGISPYTHESWSAAANSSGVLLKGALHWVVSDSDTTFISGFNLSSENFEEEILGPDSLDNKTLRSCKMMVINGCIGMIDDLSGDAVPIDPSKVNIFILKIYGSAESWTKVVVDLGDASWKKAVCIWNGWLILSVDTDRDTDHDLVGYCFDNGVWAYLNVEGDGKGARLNDRHDCCDDVIKNEQFYDGVMFSESILSPRVFSVSAAS